MNSRTSFALATGFGILIVLIAIMGFGALNRTTAIYEEMQIAQDSHLRTEQFRRGMATDMYQSEILVRDYLLDPSRANALENRQELLVVRESLQRRLDQMSSIPLGAESPRLPLLQDEVERYWESLDPIFEWTVQEKAVRASAFLRRSVLPRRQAVVDLAREMARISEENLNRESARLQANQQVLHTFLLRMVAFTLGLGIVVALLTIRRVWTLEKKHEVQRKQIEETQNNLRRLSRRLVQAQEMERMALSRELHDEVGQTMTALGIELGNMEALRRGEDNQFELRMEEAKRLNSEAMRAIRDLAMGLRPSMLDDLGIEAALQWQGREFSRHTGVPASVEVHGTLDGLSDAQRTCIYRVVQEALTNCARHANARNVLVSVQAEGAAVVVVIEDDGVGLRSGAAARGGLGLIGIQERVQELDGKLQISSEIRKGTRIRVQLPVEAA